MEDHLGPRSGHLKVEMSPFTQSCFSTQAVTHTASKPQETPTLCLVGFSPDASKLSLFFNENRLEKSLNF